MESLEDSNKFSYRKLKCKKLNHQDQKLKHLCMNPLCKNEQRLLCDYCVQDHKHGQYFIKIKDLETKSIQQIYNWPVSENKEKFMSYINNPMFSEMIDKLQQEPKNQKLTDINNLEDSLSLSKELEKQESNNINLNNFVPSPQIKKEAEQIYIQVRQLFSTFQDQLSEQLVKIEKEIIIQIQQNLYNIQKVENIIQQQLAKIFNPSELKEMFNNFRSESQMEDLLSSLDKYILNQQKKKEEQDCLKLIDKRDSKMENNSQIIDKIKSTQNKLLQQLNNIYDKAKIETALCQSKSIDTTLQFYPSTYGSSQQKVIIQGNMVQFKPDENTWKMAYSEPFHRNQQVTFKFKMSCKDIMKSFFTIGVISKEDIERDDNQFAKTGTQFAISPYIIHSKEAEYEGKRFYEIYYDGIEAQIDICIQKNELLFYDKQKNCKIFNKADLEEAEEWRLLISAHGKVAPTFIFF